VILTALFSPACDKGPGAPSPEIPVFRITGPASVAPGATANYTSELQYRDGRKTDVTASTTWTSVAPEILEIQPSGIALGRSRGETVINAKYEAMGSTFSALVLEDGTLKLTGKVAENTSSLVGIFGASVEVVSGTGTGLRATTTDYSGSYVLYGVAGDVRLRASADGYEPNTVDATVTKGSSRNIAIAPIPGGPGRLDGRWTLTLSAAQPCLGFPDAARTRQFTASISHTGTPRVGALLSSPSLMISMPLVGQIVGDELTLPIPYWPGDVVDGPEYLLLEKLPPRVFLGIRGTLRLIVNGSDATGDLDGGFDYYPNSLVSSTRVPCEGRIPATLRRE
jgi:hypothetical protein